MKHKKAEAILQSRSSLSPWALSSTPGSISMPVNGFFLTEPKINAYIPAVWLTLSQPGATQRFAGREVQQQQQAATCWSEALQASSSYH